MNKLTPGSNMLWEGSRMILPEHREAITDWRKANMAKPKRPQRDEFELEELANKLTLAHEEKSELLLTVWGEDETIRGRIVKLDPNTKRVHVEGLGGTRKIPFLDIMSADSPEY